MGILLQVSAGSGHTCALKNDLTADCWGDNFNGRADDQPGPYGLYSPWSAVTVKKVVVGTPPADDWAFTSNVAGDFTLPAAGGEKYFLIGYDSSATYTISEPDRPGWIASAGCAPGGQTGTNSVTLPLPEAVENTCTFTNTLCLAGTFDDGTICKAADPGHYVGSDGASSQMACVPGYYQPAAGQSACLAADPGYYVPGPAATEQLQCPAGTSSGPAATECTTGPIERKIFLPMVVNSPVSRESSSGGGWTVGWLDSVGLTRLGR